MLNCRELIPVIAELHHESRVIWTWVQLQVVNRGFILRVEQLVLRDENDAAAN